MANLTPTAAWSDVYKIETTDLVIGGANTAICNKQAQAIINRIEYLKNLIDTFENQVNTLDDPILMIKMWYGTISSIPAGWQLCNGTNGTPNFFDKFPLHQNSGVGLAYNNSYFYLSDSNTSVSLAGTHLHSGALGYGGYHSHSGKITAAPGQAPQGYEWRGGGGACSSGSHSHTFTTSSSGSHTHSISMTSTPSHTHSIGASLRIARQSDPPYKYMLYIMRVS